MRINIQNVQNFLSNRTRYDKCGGCKMSFKLVSYIVESAICTSILLDKNIIWEKNAIYTLNYIVIYYYVHISRMIQNIFSLFNRLNIPFDNMIEGIKSIQTQQAVCMFRACHLYFNCITIFFLQKSAYFWAFWTSGMVLETD